MKSTNAWAQKRTLLQSGTPVEHLAPGAMIKKRRKIEEENFLKRAAKKERKDGRSVSYSTKMVKKATEKTGRGFKGVNNSAFSLGIGASEVRREGV